MSRSNVAKSRTDKAGKTVSAPTPAQVHEIVPGKFNDQDWNFMVDHDDNDEFVTDIIEEVCSSALDIIYKNYIDKQLIPFTVCQAKDAIVQIIEWQFLAKDPGEGDVSADPGWCEDEEPEPAEPESWAQGSVPKTLATPRPVPIEEEPEPEPEPTEREMSQIKEETQEEIKDTHLEPPLGGLSHERTIICEDDPVLVDPAVDPALVIEGSHIEPEETPSKEKQPDVKPKKKFKPHYGPLKSAGVSKLTESLDESEMKLYRDEYGYDEATPFSPSPTMLNMPNSCHSIIKLQAGRPPGNRDVVYDSRGNVISLTKICPEQLPSHKIPTRFKIIPEDGSNRVKTRALIVDPEVEAAQARLEAMRTGRYIAGAKTKPTPPKEPKPPGSSKTGQTRSKARTNGTSYTMRTGMSMRTSKTDKSTVHDGPRSPLPPPLIESMDVSPGVIVREGDRVKKGPKQRPKQEDLIATALSKGLRSIKFNPAHASLTVSQILEQSTPVVKPLIDHSPIPPINSSQQVQ